MSVLAKTFQVTFREDGSATILGRVTARNGAGAATGVAGEGNFIKVADVSTITCNAYDMTSAPTTAVAITVTSSAIVDTVVTSTVLWTQDTTGYNFLHDIPAGTFASGDHIYRIEYKITLTGGAILWGAFQGLAQSVQGN